MPPRKTRSLQDTPQPVRESERKREEGRGEEKEKNKKKNKNLRRILVCTRF
jgi:hypothetical protein